MNDLAYTSAFCAVLGVRLAGFERRRLPLASAVADFRQPAFARR